MLEIGAGVGLVGLATARALPCIAEAGGRAGVWRVTLTDIDVRKAAVVVLVLLVIAVPTGNTSAILVIG